MPSVSPSNRSVSGALNMNLYFQTFVIGLSAVTAYFNRTSCMFVLNKNIPNNFFRKYVVKLFVDDGKKLKFYSRKKFRAD
jgi:hypothetical protein